MLELVSLFWQFLGDNVASIIAACAMGATFWQAMITRRHNKLSVKPHLTLKTAIETSGESRYLVSLSIKNTGLGPAVIQDFNLFIDDKKINLLPNDESCARLSEHIYSAFSFFDGYPNGQSLYASAKGSFLLKGEILPEKSERILYELDAPKEVGLGFDDTQATNLLNRVFFDIKYKSLYNDSYHTEKCELPFLDIEPETSNQG